MAASVEPPGLDLARVLVISPHFDDAVFSCGHLLAASPGAEVVTIFGGAPDVYPTVVLPWDADCGFAAGTDIVAARRAEDESALALLGAVPRVLEFVEGQYRETPSYPVDQISDRLATAIAAYDPTTIAFPLAIRHRDHRRSAAAALKLRVPNDRRDWIGYGEFPYVWRRRDGAAVRIAHLRRRGLGATPVLGIPQDPERKSDAMRCYTSQMTGFGFTDPMRVARAPEQLWRITRRPWIDPALLDRARAKLPLLSPKRASGGSPSAR